MNSISLFTAIPLGAAFLTALLGRKIKGLPDWLGSLGTFSLLGLSIFSAVVVKNAGGQVKRIPFVTGFSTTDIIKRIVDLYT